MNDLQAALDYLREIGNFWYGTPELTNEDREYLGSAIEAGIAENKRLSTDLKTAMENSIGMTSLYFREKDKLSKEYDRNDNLTIKVNDLMEENARLTAALVECQEAFDSGRDVGEV